MNLLPLVVITIVKAAMLKECSYYIKDESEQQFKLLGDATIIESLELLKLYLKGTPDSTLALIHEQTYVKTNGSIFLATFKVESSKAHAFFDSLSTGQANVKPPTLIGFAKQILGHEGTVTVLLQNDKLVGLLESWFGTKVLQITEQPINILFESQYGRNKSVSVWKVALEDPLAISKIIAEVSHVEQLLPPIELGILGVGPSRLIAERLDFSLTQSHDRFELTIDRAYGMILMFFALGALHDYGEIFGVRPWLGLEKVLRLELSTASPGLLKLCVYFNANAVNKADVQRVFSGFPYYSLIADLYLEPQQRKIPVYLIESYCDHQLDPNGSVLIDGKNESAREFTFSHITAKKLKDPCRTFVIQRPNSNSADVLGYSYSFSCSNISAFVARFWLDFINNKHLPEYVSHLSHFILQRSEDIGIYGLSIHLPKVYIIEGVEESLDILMFLFFRYCGIESDQSVTIENDRSDEIEIGWQNIVDMNNIHFDMCHFDMKWVIVKYTSSDEWIPPVTKKKQKKKGALKKPTQLVVTETEVKVSVSIPKPLVFPRSKPVASAPPPAVENTSSWDQFFSELDD